MSLAVFCFWKKTRLESVGKMHYNIINRYKIESFKR